MATKSFFTMRAANNGRLNFQVIPSTTARFPEANKHCRSVCGVIAVFDDLTGKRKRIWGELKIIDYVSKQYIVWLILSFIVNVNPEYYFVVDILFI